MIAFRPEAQLQNKRLVSDILAYFTAHKTNDRFWVQMHEYLIQVSGIQNGHVTPAKIGAALSLLSELRRDNLVVDNENDYRYLNGVLTKFNHQLKAYQMSVSKNTEAPASAYAYKGNNTTRLAKSPYLPSLLYRF